MDANTVTSSHGETWPLFDIYLKSGIKVEKPEQQQQVISYYILPNVTKHDIYGYVLGSSEEVVLRLGKHAVSSPVPFPSTSNSGSSSSILQIEGGQTISTTNHNGDTIAATLTTSNANLNNEISSMATATSTTTISTPPTNNNDNNSSSSNHTLSDPSPSNSYIPIQNTNPLMLSSSPHPSPEMPRKNVLQPLKSQSLSSSSKPSFYGNANPNATTNGSNNGSQHSSSNNLDPLPSLIQMLEQRIQELEKKLDQEKKDRTQQVTHLQQQLFQQNQWVTKLLEFEDRNPNSHTAVSSSSSSTTVSLPPPEPQRVSIDNDTHPTTITTTNKNNVSHIRSKVKKLSKYNQQIEQQYGLLQQAQAANRTQIESLAQRVAALHEELKGDRLENEKLRLLSQTHEKQQLQLYEGLYKKVDHLETKIEQVSIG